MAFNIGKVREYNGISGTIITENDKYMFLDKDVRGEVSAGDLVSFRGEKINETNRAFFVKQYEKEKYVGEQNKKLDLVSQINTNTQYIKED